LYADTLSHQSETVQFVGVMIRAAENAGVENVAPERAGGKLAMRY